MSTTTRFTMSSRTVGARLATSVASLGAASVVVAGGASAHVRVSPETAAAGSYATLTFKVPNESATASTTKVSVDLPSDHPFGYVGYQPVPGWTAKVTTTKLAKPITMHGETITEAPTSITWTADSASSIKPGQFQQFVITAGAMPEPTTLTMPAHQTYSDGKVVDWADATKGSTEPEHPAPTLTVTAADASGHAGHGSSGTPSASVTTTPLTQPQAAEEARRSQSDTTARWLGTGGIVMGLLGLVAAVWAATRRSAR